MTDFTRGTPIPIPCEGGGHPGHVTVYGPFAICKMCGGLFTRDAKGNVVAHRRDDILARISRGDFG